MPVPKGSKAPQIGQSMRAIHGEDYYSKLGKKGGAAKGVKKGFASMSKERLLEVSMKGLNSRRRKSQNAKSTSETDNHDETNS